MIVRFYTLQTSQFLTIATDDYVQDAGVAISSETHAGEDTPIYARGPMSFLFQVRSIVHKKFT